MAKKKYWSLNSRSSTKSLISYKAQSSIVVEYRGLSVAEMTELRRALRAENVDFKVYKNKLAQRATEACSKHGIR